MKNNLLIYVAFSGADESRVNLQNFKGKRSGESRKKRKTKAEGLTTEMQAAGRANGNGLTKKSSFTRARLFLLDMR
jgi:hypothetical protein